MRIRHVGAMVVAGLLSAPSARAQSVQGVVVAHGDTPDSGVVVLLLDGMSAIADRALSNERGTFQLVAPRTGSYRLRTLRIGFTPVTSAPFAIDAGDPRAERIADRGEPTRSMKVMTLRGLLPHDCLERSKLLRSDVHDLLLHPQHARTRSSGVREIGR